MLHQHQRCPLKVTLWVFRLWLWIANKDHISKLPEQPWYFNSAVAWHIFPLVPLQKLETSKGLDCFSPWRCASPLGVSQMYFVWQQAWVVHLVWQSVTKHKAVCWQRGTLERTVQGTSMPERPEYVNATYCWAICSLLHDSDLMDSDLLKRSPTISTAQA